MFVVLFIAAISSPALAAFTIEDEKKVGKEFYEKMEHSHALIDDPEIQGYVDAIGRQLLKQLPVTLFDYHFLVIRSLAVNAFATPGGYIYVNSGLISLVEKESQLAGVLAHEMGHVQSRHIADMINKSQKISIASLAAVLAGAFLGGGGDLTAGIAGFSMATATSLSLKYSREHEEEADRKGMDYLTRGGYDPYAMVDFLKIMRKYEYFSNSIPSYFLTHPGTDDRIAYLDSLIMTSYPVHGKDRYIGRLKRVQTRILLSSRNQDAALQHFQDDLKANPSDIDDLYGLAVTLNHMGRNIEALEAFQKALSIAPSDRDVLRDLGISYYQMGRSDKACAALEKADALSPNDMETILYLGRAYNATGNYAGAIKLLAVLKPPLSDDPDVQYNLAIAYGKTGSSGWSHYYFAMYFKKKGRLESALFHLKEAQTAMQENGEMSAKIKAEIQSIENGDKSRHRHTSDADSEVSNYISRKMIR
jgi:predicted Zn-dependent protease